MKKSFREYLEDQGLKKTSIDNYLSALRDNQKVNYQTAKNWYQKYLGTQSHTPFMQFMIDNGMALSTSKAYTSGLRHSNSIHHHRAKKWYDMYIKSTTQPQERVMMKSSTKGDLTVRSEETYIEPLLNPQNCNANIDSKVIKSTVAKVEVMTTIEIIQAILQMNVTDKNKLDMISSLLQ
jgi:hypothetical protein